MNRFFRLLILTLALTVTLSPALSTRSAEASFHERPDVSKLQVKCVDADNTEKIVSDGQYSGMNEIQNGEGEITFAIPFRLPGEPFSFKPYPDIVETKAPRGYLSNSPMYIKYEFNNPPGPAGTVTYKYNGGSHVLEIPEMSVLTPTRSGQTYNTGKTILYKYKKAPLLVTSIDEAGAAVPGADIQLLNSSGEVIEEWTSGTEVAAIDIVRPSYSYKTGSIESDITVLHAGPETFTVRVKQAVAGYEKPEDVIFLLNPDGTYDFRSASDEAVKPGTMEYIYGESRPGSKTYTDPVPVVHKKSAAVTDDPEKPDEKPVVTETKTDEKRTEAAASAGESEKAKTAKTGDENSIAIWLGMSLISLAVIVAVMVRRRRESH